MRGMQRFAKKRKGFDVDWRVTAGFEPIAGKLESILHHAVGTWILFWQFRSRSSFLFFLPLGQLEAEQRAGAARHD